MELEKAYEPQRFEPHWAEWWVESGIFHADPHAPGPRFSLAVPPPNVTGSLHIGHMLDHTVIDTATRWHRMRGDNTLFLPGTDHAGIATQMLVERSLAAEGLTRQQLGREEFVRRVWEWKEKYGNRITSQMKRIGDSCDWSRERFTLNPDLSRAVLEAFVRLYERGLIYRGTYMVNWCPRCATALSDLEVKHDDTQGNLWHIRYPVNNSSRYLIVATTRPETMLGDTAVAVNPSDPRYQDLGGQTVTLPLMNRPIPIIFDEIADPQFGTGVVKVTPAHDPNDLEAGKRHDLPQIKVIGEDAHMTADAGPYAGLDRFEARKRIVADLEKQGLLEKVEPYALAISKCDRCGTIVEPLVSTQWFVKTKPLAEKAIAAVNEGRIQFVPGQLEQDVLQLDGEHPRLVHLAPALVGPSHSGVALRQLQEDHRGSRSARGLPELPVGRADSGSRRARHLVQFQSLAVFHARLARRYRRSARLLSHEPDDHRLRHPVLLGGAHDDDGHRAHRRRAVPPGAHARAGARSLSQKDVEDQGQRGGPARHQRSLRYRCLPPVVADGRGARHRHYVQRRQARIGARNLRTNCGMRRDCCS